jgi:hypothetical protein
MSISEKVVNLNYDFPEIIGAVYVILERVLMQLKSLNQPVVKIISYRMWRRYVIE